MESVNIWNGNNVEQLMVIVITKARITKLMQINWIIVMFSKNSKSKISTGLIFCTVARENSFDIRSTLCRLFNVIRSVSLLSRKNAKKIT